MLCSNETAEPVHQLTERIVLKTKCLRRFLLRFAVGHDRSQCLILPLIDLRGLREVSPKRRIVHDLASANVS